MGGSGINAFTSKDVIVYHNSFPSNQIEKWLEVYSNRFEKPVYRLFQSELETVYEEKNMYMDNPITALIEMYDANMYKGHPYENTVLGNVENLKNPSLTKMDEYFQTYYVANNMALIISGNFNPEEIMPIIDKKFGKWRNGVVPKMPDYKLQPIEGRVEISKRLTPVKIGILGYRTVRNGHPDQIALSVCNNILSNSSSTGLLDKLMIDNELMGAYVMQMNLTMHGTNMIIFIPKIIGQPFSKAEKLVIGKIDKLKAGDFDDDLFNAVKIELSVQAQESLENAKSRAYMLMDAFVQDRSWEDMLADIEKMKKITKDDVLRVANKYYGDDFYAFHSKMGFPKKEKLEKPSFEIIEAENSEKTSDYAMAIREIPVKESTTNYIEFNQDVYFTDITEYIHYYFTPNPVNDLFKLKLVFGVGTEEIPLLEQAADHMSLLGTSTKNLDEFNRRMQLLGSSYYASASRDYFTISISGLDENFDETIALMSTLLDSLKPDDLKMKQLVETTKMNIKFEKKDPATKGRALKEYILYGEKSSFLDRLTPKQIKKLKSQQLVDVFNQMQNYEVDIHYSGTLPQKDIEYKVINNLLVVKPSIKSKSPVYRKKNEINDNVIYLVNDKKAVQSQINLMVEGDVNNRDERVISGAFNKYFSSDMSSIVFQEIREFRSLAYTAYAYHSSPFYKDKKGYTFGYMSTQADKTNEALDVFTDLIKDMPMKPNRMDHVLSALTQSVSSKRPDFRNISSNVSYWRKKGYTDDPRKYSLYFYNRMTFGDIKTFYNRNINGRPITIGIVGNMKQIDEEKLLKHGKIIELKTKDLFTW